jgi:hypothetical protein
LGSAISRLLKNYLQIEIQSRIENQRYSKSPFEKGGFRGISGAEKIPPNPPFSKGGAKNASNRSPNLFFNNLIEPILSGECAD